MDLDSQPKLKSELISLIKHMISLISSISDSEPESELTGLIPLLSAVDSDTDSEELSELILLIAETFYYVPSMASSSELRSCLIRLFSLVDPTKVKPAYVIFMDLESESKLRSLLFRFLFVDFESEWKLISLLSRFLFVDMGSELISLIHQVISFLKSMDLDSQPKLRESRLISLTAQTISFCNSMDMDSQPQPLSQLISVISQKSNSTPDLEVLKLIKKTLDLQPEPELMSLIHQTFSLAITMDPKCQKLISLGPQVEVDFENGKYHVTGKVEGSNTRMHCLPVFWENSSLPGEEATHFRCSGCNGDNHGTYKKAPLEIKHPLHPKHSLHLVLSSKYDENRKCYCCDVRLGNIFYCCLVCAHVISVACVEKPPVLSIDHPKWHEHTLAHFPRQASLTCDLCALADSSSPFFVCLLCDFVVHQSCISLPHVIRISRHPHRISFTPSFGQGNWSCGVCRREINNDYGGYSCIKDGCSYAAHSKCATQSNVWDGKELEGEPEEIEEEEVKPFVRISDGIIQHFSHEHHHLKLDENAGRDYDENKHCQACITPIYFNNYYSCMQCEFILHEACANLSRKMHHPIHPHLLTLVTGYDRVIKVISDMANYESSCSACPWLCTSGFFYECGEARCRFKVHVQCATIYEPLDHKSHMHPLFLTSKPGEKRTCSVCRNDAYPETFNCIDCDFSLCFGCATIPQKVRYKHDKHMLALSYGDETSTMTYWCEACEEKIKLEMGFYMCDEYCCVTLHNDCLIGKDFYMKPGASWLYDDIKVDVLPKNQHMSRPFCSWCRKHCPYKIVFQLSGLIFCSIRCMRLGLIRRNLSMNPEALQNFDPRNWKITKMLT
uniref:Zinc finger PHD-type domain-containing protein n=1 Tax=Noccaea caerulescens TaxID=107243 RepID=A0A1J3EJT9_NOCCA